jgi:hypothetical protein
MLSYKNYYKSFLRLDGVILTEGGQAADNLVDDLKAATGNKSLNYIRATVSPVVLDEIQTLLTVLRKKNFIKNTEPSYVLGSSRLFAIKAGLRAPEPNEVETPEIIDKALETKKDFGDIDLDVFFNNGVSAKDIAFFLNTEFAGKYSAIVSGGEVNTAVVVRGTNSVIQIDIVDITGKENFFKFTQFSSFADIAAGVKGVVRDLLIRAIASTTPIDNKKIENLNKLIEGTEQYKTFKKKNEKKGEITFSIRYTLGGAGLAYKIKWMVDGKEKGFSEGGVKYDQLHKFVTEGDAGNVSYDELEIISNILGFKTPEHMKHVVEMAKLISTFDQQRKQVIWDSLIDNIKTKIPDPSRNRRVGQMSLEDAKSALNYLLPFVGNVSNKNVDELLEKAPANILGEAVKMVNIPHIDQMSPKDFCNLFSGGAWEVSEKYDGSNVSFGLDEDDNIFVKTKRGNPITDSDVYRSMSKTLENDVFEGFGEFLDALNRSKIKNLLKSLEAKVGAPIQVFGEMFSKAHMNVIEYSPELIGSGAVVIFGIVKQTSKKGEDITTTKTGKDIKEQVINALNETSSWKAYDKKPLDLTIKDIIKKQIKRVCSIENMAVMASRARKGDSVALKAKAVQEFERLKSLVKRNLLTNIKSVSSSLGAKEIEGTIIRNMENGAIAKLVDLEDFGRRRVEQWAGVDALKEYRKRLYMDLKNDILKNADIFILNDKQMQKLNDAIETRGAKFSNMNEIFDVFYGDAAAEVEFLESRKMVASLIETLKEYKIDIEGALLKIDSEDVKSKTDTQNAINAEKSKIDKFIQKLEQSISGNENPYLAVIEFILSPKFLDELKAKFIKTASA